LNKIIKLKKSNKIYVTAHRGASKEAAENSLLAFYKAIEIGADLIEMDIHLTKERNIVVIHDANTKRVGDKFLVIKESTYDQIQEVNLKDNQKIPLLDEVFEKFKGKIGFVIEIKANNLAEILVDKIKEYDVYDSCIIISFKHKELIKFKQLIKEIPVATLEPTGSSILSGWFLRNKMLNNVNSLGFDGIHPYYKFVNKNFVENAHKLNLFVNPWTVDNENIMRDLIQMNVDGITTNDPRKLISILNQ